VEGAFHANKTNDTAASSGTLSLTVPSLTLGQPLNDQFTASGQSRYYQVTVPAGTTLVLDLLSTDGTAANELFIREGALPMSPVFDAHAGMFTSNAKLTFGPTQADTYFIQVHNQSGAVGGSAFTLTATQPDFALFDISANRGGNSGPVTVRVDGAGFDDVT